MSSAHEHLAQRSGQGAESNVNNEKSVIFSGIRRSLSFYNVIFF